MRGLSSKTLDQRWCPTSKWEVEVLSSTFQHLAINYFFVCLFDLFVCLRPHPRHMEVPRLGAQSERYLLAYTTTTAVQDPSHVYNLHHSSQQGRILNPLSKARDGRHSWACCPHRHHSHSHWDYGIHTSWRVSECSRSWPIQSSTSWFLVKFISTAPRREAPNN